MAAVDNEDVCRLQMLYPKQFISFPAVDPADVDGAVAEIEYYVKTYGIKGIAMEPGWSMPPVYVDDRKLDPVYAACEEHGLICAFTLSVLAGEDLSYCNPIAVQHTALRFPRVAFTVSHGCWPFVEEFLGTALQCMNVYCYPGFLLKPAQHALCGPVCTGGQFIHALPYDVCHQLSGQALKAEPGTVQDPAL